MEQLTNKELDSSRESWPGLMEEAMALATSVLTAAPNPRVGCVLEKSGSVIGRGWHQRAGNAHAEVNAISDASQSLVGATAFVSLEPCSHHGKTGPCTEALIEAGISRVVIASLDPNPKVSGSGVKRLQEAGIEVCQLVEFEGRARALNPGFYSRHELGRPFVRCKLAASLDGRTALSNGKSKWITGEQARADVQLLRARSCAVVTGINSILVDNSALTLRPADFTSALQDSPENLSRLQARLETLGQPLRVVLDSQLRTPPDAAILNDANALVITSEACASQGLPGAEVVGLPATDKGVQPASVLEFLFSWRSCNEILIEAGPTLSAAFLELGLVDELVIFIGNRLLGSDGKPLLELGGLLEMDSTPEVEFLSAEKIGEDLKIIARPKP